MNLGHAELYTRGKLIAGDAGRQLGIARMPRAAVQPLKKLRGKVVGTDAGWACQVPERFTGVGPAGNAAGKNRPQR